MVVSLIFSLKISTTVRSAFCSMVHCNLCVF